jgi:hypothetical protein
MKYLKHVNPWLAFWLIITIVRLVIHYSELNIVSEGRLWWYWAMFGLAVGVTIYSVLKQVKKEAEGADADAGVV